MDACSRASRRAWDVRLSNELSFDGVSLSNAVNEVNATVCGATKTQFPQVIILDVRPVVITKIGLGEETNSNMDALIERYQTEVPPLIAKGAESSETCPVWEHFPAGFHVSDVGMGLAMLCEMEFEFRPDGFVLKSPRKHLECRVYKVSDALLALVGERQKAGQIYHAFKPVPVTFAQESAMTWSIMVSDGTNQFKGEEALDAVTYYLPDKKQILVIENAEGHKRIQESLKAKGLWEEYLSGWRSRAFRPDPINFSLG